MKIQQIRNATLKIEYGGVVFLIDPWLEDKGTGFSAPAVLTHMKGVKSPLNELPFPPEEVLKGVDHCLVTHIHPDHFSIDYLPRDISVIVPNNDEREKVERMGFSNVTAFGENEINLGAVAITKVPALHGDNIKTVDHAGKSCGYVLQGEDKTVYIAGDTVYFSGVEQTIEAYRPDVIVINCCEATLPIGRLIMNLADIEAVCKKAPDAIVVATHLDSVNHALVSGSDVRAFAARKNLTQVQVPANGEYVVIQ